MRGCTVSMVAFHCVVLLAANSSPAAGPQFTGLLNFYNTSGTGFNKTGNSLATMDLNGPVDATAVSLPGDWSDIVVAPGGSAYYAIVNFNQEFYKINPITLAATKLTLNSPVPPGEDHSWLVGETWDTTRNRLVVASLGGTGFFFGYLDQTDQWITIGDLHQFDLRSVTYRPSNDVIYGLPNTIGGPITEIRKYSPATGQQVGTLTLPVSIPEHEFGTDLQWQMMLANDGELAIIAPRFVPRPGGGTMQGNWLYLINPDSGVISYSAPLPVPEPGMMGVLLMSCAMLSRRRRH